MFSGLLQKLVFAIAICNRLLLQILKWSVRLERNVTVRVKLELERGVSRLILRCMNHRLHRYNTSTPRNIIFTTVLHCVLQAVLWHLPCSAIMIVRPVEYTGATPAVETRKTGRTLFLSTYVRRFCRCLDWIASKIRNAARTRRHCLLQKYMTIALSITGQQAYCLVGRKAWAFNQRKQLGLSMTARYVVRHQTLGSSTRCQYLTNQDLFMHHRPPKSTGS